MPTSVAMVIGCQLMGAVAIAQNRARPGVDVLNRNVRSFLTPLHAPESLSQLIGLSPIVVIATCEGELASRFSVKEDPRSDVVTDRIVRVNGVFKGNLAPETQIAVQEFGGSLALYDGIHSIKQVIVHQKSLEKQQRYVLFLRPVSEVANDRFDGLRFSITGIWAGSFQVVNGIVRVFEEAQPGLRALDGLTEVEVLARVRNTVISEMH